MNYLFIGGSKDGEIFDIPRDRGEWICVKHMSVPIDPREARLISGVFEKEIYHQKDIYKGSERMSFFVLEDYEPRLYDQVISRAPLEKRCHELVCNLMDLRNQFNILKAKPWYIVLWERIKCLI